MDNWKEIPNTGKYEVSNDGRVRNSKSGLVLKTGWTRGGYEKVNLYYDGNMHNAKIHRLVAEAFVPKKEGCSIVNHIDGNKHNNCFTNLEWCTSKDNSIHAFSHGLSYRSENSGVPKRKVEIVETRMSFDSVSDCARYLNVARSHIFACLSGKRKMCCGYTFRYIDDKRRRK